MSSGSIPWLIQQCVPLFGNALSVCLPPIQLGAGLLLVSTLAAALPPPQRLIRLTSLVSPGNALFFGLLVALRGSLRYNWAISFPASATVCQVHWRRAPVTCAETQLFDVMKQWLSHQPGARGVMRNSKRACPLNFQQGGANSAI